MSTQIENPKIEKKPAHLNAPPTAKPVSRPAAPAYHSPYDEEEEPGFFQRHRGVLILVVIGAVVGIFFGAKKIFPEHNAPAKRQQDVIMIRPLPPTPPAPTPPPPPQTPQEPKMVEQTPVAENEEKPQPKEEAPPDIGTNIQGPGDSFGLGRSTGGGTIGGTSGGRGSGSRWGWYASQVQTRITEALRDHRKTRTANINRVTVRIWPDSVGRITRVSLGGTTGDAGVDAAIRDEILNGLQLQEPPPAGMPSPIVLRITAERKN